LNRLLNRFSLPTVLLLLLLLFCSCPGRDAEKTGVATPVESKADQRKPESDTRKGGDIMEIKVTSTAFKEGEFIPKKYTGEGADISPPLSWDKSPEGTKSIALICDDPDAPVGTWVHWVIFNIKPDMTTLQENIPMKKEVLAVARQGSNDFRKIGYGGPMPPPGKPHRYFFKVYALDKILDLPAGAKKADLEKAMERHILAKGQLLGKYKR